jgi:hypothetical protein
MRGREGFGLPALAGVVVAALLLPSVGGAVGGRYAFAGGTPRERIEVVRALDASSFDWQLVAARITIHIERGTPSRATPGEIWLDANLLEAGSFAWGVIQHEYAHQVDFFLLTAATRALLLAELGGSTWCKQGAGPSPDLGCERFASTLAWAYWPSADNCMRPTTRRGMSRTHFRHLLSGLIDGEGAAGEGEG